MQAAPVTTCSLQTASTSRWVRWPTTIVTAAALLAGCSSNQDRPATSTPLAAQPMPPAPASSTSTAPTASDSASPPPATPTSQPSAAEIATEWFVAYQSMRWTDTSPASWIDRVHPFVTESLHDSDAVLRGGTRGVDWTEFVAGRCSTSASDVDAVVPAEAPHTESLVYVQVIGTLHTACDRQTSMVVTTDAAATLAVIQTPRGWRVNERLY
jgi:hypothetical protein